MSPELYLRRPPAENEEWRLDRLLQRKAEEGVRIYISVYKEVSEIMLNQGSKRVGHRLIPATKNLSLFRPAIS